MSDGPLLDVSNLSTIFHVGSRGLFQPPLELHAVADVSFTMERGETLGIVGESGCGKSTLGRSILRLIEPTAGRVVFAGTDLANLDDEAMRQKRRGLQIIFQDPVASLNPRMTVGDIIAEPLTVFEPELDRAARRSRVLDIMRRVGLLPDPINRYPHAFSGGQAQRIGIARAIVLEPEIVVCDEPVSALDVSIQAQIINILVELKTRYGLTLIFISHDLSVVRHICDRLLVLYMGRTVEIGEKHTVFNTPAHPYTQALLSSALVPDPVVARSRKLTALSGEVPSPLNPPSGCAFRTRCPYARQRCADERPHLRPMASGQDIACHFAADLTDTTID